MAGRPPSAPAQRTTSTGPTPASRSPSLPTSPIVARSPTGAFSYRWQIDGAIALSGTVASLAPGEWITLTMPWHWQQERHWVSFEADAGRQSRGQRAEQQPERSDRRPLPGHPRPSLCLRGLHALPEPARLLHLRGLAADAVRADERALRPGRLPEAPQGILERVRINTHSRDDRCQQRPAQLRRRLAV